MIDHNSLKHIADLLWKLGEFLFITVFVKYIVIRWVADTLKKTFILCFVRSRREIAIWLHYQNQARSKGHKHDTPIDCNDGDCKIV